ncbi:MAG: MmcQ/YjbR family DNA-binding protein [Bryobacteraceae bacterium]
MTFESVRQIALSLDNVTEGTSYGTPAFFVKRVLFARWRPDLDSLVAKVDFDRREEMMAEDPETYYITDHYLNYEWVLVRLARMAPDAMADVLRMAWKAAAGARQATMPPKRASTKRSPS